MDTIGQSAGRRPPGQGPDVAPAVPQTGDDVPPDVAGRTDHQKTRHEHPLKVADRRPRVAGARNPGGNLREEART
ncbi:hypothetical protein GCM10023194_46560 [Planotetraspora phitsanulokensis]|uniref:Uncharacterized protein n=1 Tax=Planotetraspora phitsanulokensis TaxID=575192 RepID=A0A8J3U1B4_9ACTN|nr:hypothetical protein Pph01_17360 [Planotetraspora phitsanulokensis]